MTILALLGVLNSSTACFWLKQVVRTREAAEVKGKANHQCSGSDFYEFTGTKLKKFPLPAELPLEFGRELDGLAQRLSAVEPSAVCAEPCQPGNGWTRRESNMSTSGAG